VRTRKAKYRERKPEERPWSWYAVSQAASKVPITYTSRPDATPQAEISTLAAVYEFLLNCHAKKAGACPDDTDDTPSLRNAEEVSHVDRQPD
jgi:hypothetical protein